MIFWILKRNKKIRSSRKNKIEIFQLEQGIFEELISQMF